MQSSAVTYRKTKAGTWVVFGPASAVKVGRVEVVKRDGSRKTETVTGLGKTFRADGTEMVYGYLAARNQQARSETCDECGEPGARHHRYDSSGLPGLVCSRCNRSSRYELSFA